MKYSHRMHYSLLLIGSILVGCGAIEDSEIKDERSPISESGITSDSEKEAEVPSVENELSEESKTSDDLNSPSGIEASPSVDFIINQPLSEFTTLQPTITWNPAFGKSDSVSYHIEIFQADCTTLVVEQTLTDVISWEISQQLEYGKTYCVDITATNQNGVSEKALSNGTTTIEIVSLCPVGFVLVPENPTIGIATTDFCLAQFEMKAKSNSDGSILLNSNNGGVAIDGSLYTPASVSAGTPWVRLNIGDAIAECASLGSGYHLSTHAEWQTAARNIELVAENWTGGSVGNGQLYTGHSDSAIGVEICPDSNSVTYDGKLILSACDGLNPYIGTGNTNGDAVGSGREQKRTLVLSNGSIVWDMPGNVREMVDHDGLGGGVDYTGSGSTNFYNTNSVEAISTFDQTYGAGNLIETLFRPFSDQYTNAHGIGSFYIVKDVNVNRIITRGGNFSSGNGPGIYAGDLDAGMISTSSSGGFRCAWTIP